MHTGPEGGESSIAWSSQAEAGHREGGHRAGRTREPRRTSCGGDYEDDLSEGQQEPAAGGKGLACILPTWFPLPLVPVPAS